MKLKLKRSAFVVHKQLPIDDASKKILADIRVSIYNTISDKLSEDVFTGKITIGKWEESMKSALRELHSSMAAIGKGGWDQMTPADWGTIGPVVKEQYRYLHGFSEKISTDRDFISLKAIKARAKMYGRAGGVSAATTQADRSIINQLPYIPKDGSAECLVNCKCRWQLDIIEADGEFQLVQATWFLSPAEHCDTCVDRKGNIVIIRVHNTVSVPSIIGGF